GDVNVMDNEQESYHQRFQWLPNEAASLLYLYKTGDLVIPDIYEARSGSDTQPISMGDYDFYLSPDGNQLVYKFVSDEDDASANLRVLNLESQEISQIVETYRWSSNVQWLSESQFVYVHREVDNASAREIYLYDVNTRESRQLTNTPELEE